mmetsp:Transcript_56783/g.135494  ORF Transcript_56783/g.135494 Transcript_56783/m.135494 type:complete len:222 (-) Transcript_56783:948-1613(-)
MLLLLFQQMRPLALLPQPLVACRPWAEVRQEQPAALARRGPAAGPHTVHREAVPQGEAGRALARAAVHMALRALHKERRAGHRGQAGRAAPDRDTAVAKAEKGKDRAGSRTLHLDQVQELAEVPDSTSEQAAGPEVELHKAQPPDPAASVSPVAALKPAGEPHQAPGPRHSLQLAGSSRPSGGDRARCQTQPQFQWPAGHSGTEPTRSLGARIDRRRSDLS